MAIADIVTSSELTQSQSTTGNSPEIAGKLARSRVGRLRGVQIAALGSYVPDRRVRNEGLPRRASRWHWTRPIAWAGSAEATTCCLAASRGLDMGNRPHALVVCRAFASETIRVGGLHSVIGCAYVVFFGKIEIISRNLQPLLGLLNN